MERVKGPELRSGLNSGRRALGEIGNLVVPTRTTLNGDKESRVTRNSSQPLKGSERSGLHDRTQLSDLSASNAQPSSEVSALLNNLREKAKNPQAQGTGILRPTRSNTYKRDVLDAPSGSTSNRSSADPAAHLNLSNHLQHRKEQAQMARKNIPDIDAADSKNVLACSVYVNDIYDFWRQAEPEFQPSADYMQNQTDINDRMRAILIDWLIEVHLKFKLMPETLYLTVNIIDRFLAREAVGRKHLQLVGVTAMLIAAKYEEIWAPEVRDFVYISDKAYTRQQILQMEKKILGQLSFQLTVPTPHHFLVRFCKAAATEKETEVLASFLTELALPEYAVLNYSGSLLAASAVYTALKTNGYESFPPALQYHSKFSEAQIKPCAQFLAQLHQGAATANLLAVNKKYSQSRFIEVAKTPACTNI
eukprot:CAMPEP_0196575376 /NCGR_PEP_ID=MMETSP1081-20130531/4869_1 /TAXON_ID=36882 /ORGANISM="Pyramimonas amylifera, Strain CCMP720" /LENGTH=419 /DNA_ID=CAMNT_0041893659 /DNA_START=206 /DNA_END=1465 /DNA_ORIENTATION=-